MVNYICKCCNYETDRKSSYEKHLNSDKHKKVVKQNPRDDVSTISGESTHGADDEASTTSNKSIIDLEYQLKIKENEIQSIINEFTLKLQMKDLEIKHRDETIAMLRNQLQQPTKVAEKVVEVQQQKPTPNLDLVINEVPPTKSKRPLKQALETDFQNAPTIEKCKEFLLMEQHNCFIQTVGHNDEEVPILHQDKIRRTEFDLQNTSIAIQLIKSFVASLPKNELPFYCSDKRRHVLHLKTQNGWMKETEENKIEFDKLILNFGKSVLFSIQTCLFNTNKIFKTCKGQFNDIYNMHYDTWTREHMPEILLAISPIGNDDEETKQLNDKLVHKIKLLFSESSKKIENCQSDTEN